ncbi:MAG: hypothetical protein WCF38_13635 [Pseudolabrys sp.]
MPRRSYVLVAMRKPSLAILVFLSAISTVPAHAQNSVLGDNYSIMVPEKGYKPSQPEPWLAPKYTSPGGTVKNVKLPKSTIVPTPSAQVPPDLYVPQTGSVLPNLPTEPGVGRGGAETFQDRAARCAHQAGVYGQAAGDRGSYMGACVNQ